MDRAAVRRIQHELGAAAGHFAFIRSTARHATLRAETASPAALRMTAPNGTMPLMFSSREIAKPRLLLLPPSSADSAVPLRERARRELGVGRLTDDRF